MNWAEQWLNRSQWFKDKYLKERYLVAEAVLHALSDPSPRVDLPLPYADMDEFIRALLDLEKIAGKNLFHPQQPNATPIDLLRKCSSHCINQSCNQICP